MATMTVKTYQKSWFKSNAYATFAQWESEPAKCIAPRKDGQRCRIDIGPETEAHAKQALTAAQELTHGSERDLWIEHFIVRSCCGEQHNFKLLADRTNCLDLLVRKFDNEICVRTGVVNTRGIGCNDVPPPSLRTYTYFIPYKTDPKDTVRSCLLDTPSKYGIGNIYSFTLDEDPGYVKIGFTSKDVGDRIRAWRKKCHPGAKLSSSACIDSPDKIERLVHLQLAAVRHRIVICNACTGSHDEWFKTSAEEVNRVMREWVCLMHGNKLFGAGGQLLKAWRTRIQLIDEDITARILLDWLKLEKRYELSQRAAVFDVLEPGDAVTLADFRKVMEEIETELKANKGLEQASNSQLRKEKMEEICQKEETQPIIIPRNSEKQKRTGAHDAVSIAGRKYPSEAQVSSNAMKGHRASDQGNETEELVSLIFAESMETSPRPKMSEHEKGLEQGEPSRMLLANVSSELPTITGVLEAEDAPDKQKEGERSSSIETEVVEKSALNKSNEVGGAGEEQRE